MGMSESVAEDQSGEVLGVDERRALALARVAEAKATSEEVIADLRSGKAILVQSVEEVIQDLALSLQVAMRRLDDELVRDLSPDLQKLVLSRYQTFRKTKLQECFRQAVNRVAEVSGDKRGSHSTKVSTEDGGAQQYFKP